MAWSTVKTTFYTRHITAKEGTSPVSGSDQHPIEGHPRVKEIMAVAAFEWIVDIRGLSVTLAAFVTE